MCHFPHIELNRRLGSTVNDPVLLSHINWVEKYTKGAPFTDRLSYRQMAIAQRARIARINITIKPGDNESFSPPLPQFTIFQTTQPRTRTVGNVFCRRHILMWGCMKPSATAFQYLCRILCIFPPLPLRKALEIKFSVNRMVKILNCI